MASFSLINFGTPCIQQKPLIRSYSLQNQDDSGSRLTLTLVLNQRIIQLEKEPVGSQFHQFLLAGFYCRVCAVHAECVQYWLRHTRSTDGECALQAKDAQYRLRYTRGTGYRLRDAEQRVSPQPVLHIRYDFLTQHCSRYHHFPQVLSHSVCHFYHF